MRNVRVPGAFAVVSILVLVGAGGAVAATAELGALTSVEDTGYAPIAAIKARSAALFKNYPLPALQNGVDTYRLTFWSRDFDGSPAPITALLYLPRLAQSAELPVLVFGSGTTGIGDACAPSLEVAEGRHFGDYKENMLAYAGMGIITIFPDSYDAAKVYTPTFR